MPIQLAHRLDATPRRRFARSKKVNFLRPDGKSQVTIEYRNGRPARIDTVVISTQHDEKVSNEDLRDAIMEHVIKPIRSGGDAGWQDRSITSIRRGDL